MTASHAVTLEQIDERFRDVNGHIFKIDQKFEEVMDAIDTLGKSMNTIEKSMYVLQEAHLQHFQITQDIRRRVITLEDYLVDVQESLDFLTLAEEKDAEATINHELRIARIEKANGIEGSAPTHLSDFE